MVHLQPRQFGDNLLLGATAPTSGIPSPGTAAFVSSSFGFVYLTAGLGAKSTFAFLTAWLGPYPTYQIIRSQ